jgi:hypothetical protein
VLRFVATGSGEFTVGLAEDPEKRHYAYYNMALRSYLMNKTWEAESYTNRAQAMQINPDVSEADSRYEADEETLCRGPY